MFLGKYEHTIDCKNRLTLPAKFTPFFKEKIYVSKGFDGCLEIRTPDEFKNFLVGLSKFSEFKKDTRNASRIIYANSHVVDIDGSKRILLPNDLVKSAGLIKNIVIIGVGTKLEVWDKSKYDQFEKEITPSYEAIVERLENRND